MDICGCSLLKKNSWQTRQPRQDSSAFDINRQELTMATGISSEGRETRVGWLDLRALTEYACVSERTIRGWIHSPTNPLPAVQVGRKILVSRRMFDTWLERHTVRPLEEINIDVIVREVVEGVRRGR